MTVNDLSKVLKQKNIELPKSYCNEIISYACDVAYEQVVSKPLEQYDALPIMSVVEQLVSGIPLQYITNRANFYDRDFYVNEDTLIPRVDSELLIEIILDKMKNKDKNKTSHPYHIVDICCGSGCLGITLAKELEFIEIPVELTLVEVAKKTAHIAKINCQEYGIRANILNVSILDQSPLDVDKNIDLIVCNPPYISSEEYLELDGYVKKEPKIALVPEGSDVLVFYKSVAKIAKRHRANVCFEISYNKGLEVMKLLENIFDQEASLELYKDLNGNHRAIYVGI